MTKMKWYYSLVEDVWPQLMAAEDAVNYSGPFETEVEALKALAKDLLGEIANLEQYTIGLRTTIVLDGLS